MIFSISEYDGPFSSYTEWHSAIIGLFAGLLAGWSDTLRQEVRQEPHYALGFCLAGVALAHWLTR